MIENYSSWGVNLSKLWLNVKEIDIHMLIICIQCSATLLLLYSGKLSREKTFTNFVVESHL